MLWDQGKKVVILKEPGSDPPANIRGPPKEEGGYWDSPWGQRPWQQPLLGAHSTTRTMLQASTFWNPPSSSLTLGPCPAHQPVGTSPGTSHTKQLAKCWHNPTHQQANSLMIQPCPPVCWHQLQNHKAPQQKITRPSSDHQEAGTCSRTWPHPPVGGHQPWDW